MTDPDKIAENIEDLLEIDRSEESNDTEDKDGNGQEIVEGENSSQRRKRRGITPRIFSLARKAKWIIILVLLPLGALIAIGVTVDFRYLKNEKERNSTSMRPVMSVDSLKEEGLSPFFIPLTYDQNRRMVRLDLSVIWSALAAVKYKKNELKIRDQMYNHLMLFLRDSGDSSNVSDLLENSLKGILQNSLGIYNLEVKVREINYF